MSADKLGRLPEAGIMKTDFWTLNGRNSGFQSIAERMSGANRAGRSLRVLLVWLRRGLFRRCWPGTSAAARIPLGAVAHVLPALED